MTVAGRWRLNFGWSTLPAGIDVIICAELSSDQRLRIAWGDDPGSAVGLHLLHGPGKCAIASYTAASTAQADYVPKCLRCAGTDSQRLSSCGSYTLPAEYAPFLNTSFLGQRQSLQVGPTDYSYFEFGPLQPLGAAGLLQVDNEQGCMEA